jgi:photosystem II stability/assembly factor-like uncharacterized protein
VAHCLSMAVGQMRVRLAGLTDVIRSAPREGGYVKGLAPLALWTLAVGLAGCSVSADMSRLAAAKVHPTQRFDQFQAAADNGKVLVVVGSNGVIVTSKDRGASWQRQEIGASASLIGVAACADGSFGALDFFHRVWLADADGAQWQAKPLADPGSPLAITCDRRNRLWVVGSNNTIVASADRGASWTKRVVNEGGDAMLASVQFVDDRNGFVSGEFGSVYRTSDGGASWSALPKIGADFAPYAALFADAERGWVSGLAGVVMQTKDGGKTWQKQTNPLAAPIYGLAIDRGTVVGVGVNGLLFRQDGDEWAVAGAQPATYLRAVLPLADGKTIVAGGAGTVAIAMLAKPTALAAVAN